MILSTQTDYLGKKFGNEEAVRRIADAGFDAIDLSLFDIGRGESPFLLPDWRERAASLLAEASKRGKFFNQAHAPFPSSKDGDDAYNTEIFDRIVRSFEVASLVGAKCIVVHPLHHIPYLQNRERLKEENTAFYRALAPYAKKAGVRIALENMWQREPETKKIIASACSTPADFIDWLDSLGDDCFTACLDLGHCGLYGCDAAEMIYALGNERIKALHVHDNDFLRDAHMVPYAGKMDWESICRALSDIGYRGELTLEADCFFGRFPLSVSDRVLSLMEGIGRELILRIEG